VTTLVLIHGKWCGPYIWQRFRPFLEARGHRVVTPILRHHHAAPGDPPPAGLGGTSLLDYADDLEAEIRGLGDAPVIIGHSMGGTIAQILTARGLARAAVFLCPAPVAGWPAIAELVSPSVVWTLAWHMARHAIWGIPYRLSFYRACYSSLNNMPAAQQKAEYARWVHESGRALAELGFWFLDRRRASWVDAHRVTCPTLTVGAGHDRITPEPVARLTARRYAGAGGTYRHFPENAHYVVAEPGWEAVAGCVADWIDGLDLDAAPARAAASGG